MFELARSWKVKVFAREAVKVWVLVDPDTDPDTDPETEVVIPAVLVTKTVDFLPEALLMVVTMTCEVTAELEEEDGVKVEMVLTPDWVVVGVEPVKVEVTVV